MIDSSCRRHDGRDVMVAAEGGQSTPSQPGRDTESIIAADTAPDKLEVGDFQCVKHVEPTPQCKLPSCSTELWNELMIRTGLFQSTYEDESAEKLNC